MYNISESVILSQKISVEKFFFGQKIFFWIRICDIYSALFVPTKRFFLAITKEKLDF